MRISITFLIFLLLFGAPTVYAETKTSYHVNSSFDIIPNNTNDSRNVILVTIDDGPSIYTKDILMILAQHNVKAIFFINGIQSKKYASSVALASKAGHEIGNHTWSHIKIKKENDVTIIYREIDTMTKRIVKLTGKLPRFFRPPYGQINQETKEYVKKQSMVLMNWSGSALDWERSARDNEAIFLRNITDDLHPGEIILLHEHSWTVRYLDKLLTTLREKGYSFVDPSHITY
jgi:peptidoglycan/xylan/chitin deacetylase (PgdA/CDA1 family)